MDLMKISILTLCTLVAMLGCQKAEDNLSPQREEEETEQYLSVSYQVEDLPDIGDLRMSFQNKLVDGQKRGMKLTFKPNERVRVYTYFKQGGQIFPARPTELIIPRRENDEGYYKGKFNLRIPRGIDLARGGITVAGAIGVTGIDADGRASVDYSGELQPGARADDYVPPMYFAETPLDASKRSIFADFKFYGALVELSLKSELFDPVYPRQMVLITDAFSTRGRMDLTKATASAEPSWTTTDGERSYQRVSFNGGLMKSGEIREIYIWVKPNKYTGTRRLTAHVREDYFEINPDGHSEAITRKYDVKPLDNRSVYRLPMIKMESDLIYSEYNRGMTENCVWEIYNPTNKNIDLSNYYHVIRPHDQGESANKSMSLTSQNLRLVVDNVGRRVSKNEPKTWKRKSKPPKGSLMLPPGKTALYVSNTETVNSKNRKDAAYVFRFHNQEDTPFKGLVGGVEMGMITKGGTTDRHIVDVFFYMRGNPRRLEVVDYVRRPDRNFPRTFMNPEERDEDSDWVYRTLTGLFGYGIRFDRVHVAPNKPDAWIGGRSTTPARYSHLNYGRVGKKEYKAPTYWQTPIAH